ncbi:GGDEF domain-containing phosphodiesterase [Bacillus sp. JCM 19034]|uniref:sensor domain-containing protein n=1 Tax=Bacillus sp. JCM 19034 TaxID=1481928 RepID=UPI0007842E44|nr:GGDEF domain-containing phosphodiesterase [Bacillus sp. JCM 19034]
MNPALARFLENDKNIETLFRCIKDGLLLIDGNFSIIAMNPAVEQMTGFSQEDVMNKPIQTLFSSLSHQTVSQIYDTLKTNKSWSGELQTIRHQSDCFWATWSITAVEQGSGNLYYLANIRDVTDQIEKNEKIAYISNFDTLTKLPNRFAFTQLVEQLLLQENRRTERFDLLYLNLDRFDKYNRDYGLEVGDQLILEMANRLRDVIKSGLVSRFNSDKFMILLQNQTKAKTLAIIEKVFAQFERPFMVGDHPLYLTINMGISSFPENGGDVQALFRQVDCALFHAKKDGRNHYMYYKPYMNDRTGQELSLETSLFQAFNSNEFEVFYQLQVDVETSKPYGVEALVRWNHPENGVLSPGLFLPLAEEIGLLARIDEWVLNEACKQGKLWHDAGYKIVVSVNVSKAFFKQPDFIKRVERAIVNSGLDPQFLCLEITEQTAALQMEEIRRKLKILKRFGIHVSLDDFGTGYSSLSQLNLFPIDTLKIDQSLVRGEPSKTKSAIVGLIIGIAKTLEMNVICEGVETEEQLQLLKAKGCNRAQGYYFGKPVSSSQCEALMKA